MASGDDKRNIIIEAVEAAKKELENYKDRPEHYSVMLKHPNIDATGIYSEIDMDIAARFRRCDTYAKSKSIYEQAMYNHLRQEIVTKGAGLKEKVEAVSQQHRVLTRAARLCKDEDAKKIILQQADKLKESESVKKYNQLLTGLESYAGVRNFKMDGKTVAALENSIGYVTSGDIDFAGVSGKGVYHERPEQIDVNFRSMDEYFEQFKESHPAAKEKSEEELGGLYPTFKLFEKSVMQYGKDALEDTLNSRFSTMDERLDLIMINGQTLREMVAENDKIEGRDPKQEHTLEELNDISCNILSAALKSEARVETFVLEAHDNDKKVYYNETVPMVANKPEERVSMNFWEKFMSKFGFYKEKAQKFKEQQEMDRKMEACKKRVMEKMSKPVSKEEKAAGKQDIKFSEPMTKEKIERLKNAREIAKANCDNFVRDVRVAERTVGERERLTYSFFPEEGKERNGVTIPGKVDDLKRDKALYNCVTMMLQRGIPFEEVLDSTKHKELRVEIGKELKEKFPTMTEDEYDALHLDGARRMVKHLDGFAQKMSKEINSYKDIQEKFAELYLGTLCAQVLSMDNYMNKEKVIAECGGEKQFEAMRAKLEEAGNIYNIQNTQRTVMKTYYDVLMDKGINVANIMYANYQKVGILQGLHSKKPSFNPHIDMYHQQIYKGIMKDHPEVKKLQEKADKLDKNLLNDLLSTGGENYAHMELEIYEKEANNLEPIGKWEAGKMPIKVNVMINGQGIGKLDSPQKVQNEPEMEEVKSM